MWHNVNTKHYAMFKMRSGCWQIPEQRYHDAVDATTSASAAHVLNSRVRCCHAALLCGICLQRSAVCLKTAALWFSCCRLSTCKAEVGSVQLPMAYVPLYFHWLVFKLIYH
jgi:hypothetical protein